MITRLLSETEFKATMKAPMRDVTQTATNVIDIWPYVESVPVKDLQCHVVYDHFVEIVYRHPEGLYDHVSVMTKTKNVNLVIVVDNVMGWIHGHHLLDLNRIYGLPTS